MARKGEPRLALPSFGAWGLNPPPGPQSATTSADRDGAPLPSAMHFSLPLESQRTAAGAAWGDGVSGVGERRRSEGVQRAEELNLPLAARPRRGSRAP